MSREDMAQVTELLAEARKANALHVLGEQQRLELNAGSGGDFLALLERDGETCRITGYAHMHKVRSAGGSALSGDPASRGTGWEVQVVLHPQSSSPPEEATRRLLRAAAEHVRRRGGGWLGYWASAPTASEEDLAAELGLVKSREIYQLRRPLPVKEGEVPGARDVPAIRHFIPGSDEQAWVAVNNRAFAGHPDQGGWGVQRLLTLESEAWFDPQGFLIHEREGRMAGFCWTKVHPDEEPALGEIYVIAVDPDFSGRGLGRGLTLAGLDYLATKGLSVGMLYVDETNEAARRLYGSLGFSLHHVDRMYSGRF